MKGIKILILLLLVSISSYCNIPENIKIINRNNIYNKTIDEKLLIRYDSLLKANNNYDTVYYNTIMKFLTKEAVQYRKDKISEARLKLCWPIWALISIMLLIVSVQRKEGGLQLFALASLLLSLFMTGISLKDISVLFNQGSMSLLYMIL